MRSYWLAPAVLAAAVLAGCARSGAIVQTEDGATLTQYQAIGVLPFNDPKGQGAVIADDIEGGLERMMYTPVDSKVLAGVLSHYKIDPQNGLGIEALEDIRDKTSADAFIMGRMAPDWSAASIILVDASMGDQVMRAILKPTGKKEKVFATPDEIAQAALKVLARLH